MFKKGTRPELHEFFVLFHQPNQLLRSLQTIKYSWNIRKDQFNYEMKFGLNDIEVLLRRNRYRNPCNENWQEYDADVMKQHLEETKCKAPYQTQMVNHSFCASKEKIKQAKFTLVSKNSNHKLPPCRSMERIDYTYEEVDLSASSDWDGKGHFWFTINLLNAQYKVSCDALVHCITINLTSVYNKLLCNYM